MAAPQRQFITVNKRGSSNRRVPPAGIVRHIIIIDDATLPLITLFISYAITLTFSASFTIRRHYSTLRCFQLTCRHFADFLHIFIFMPAPLPFRHDAFHYDDIAYMACHIPAIIAAILRRRHFLFILLIIFISLRLLMPLR
jgi:hypothetical protein